MARNPLVAIFLPVASLCQLLSTYVLVLAIENQHETTPSLI